jgi:hypothetical protein
MFAKLMGNVMYIIFKKFICFLIPISIILTSCAHIPEITKPANGDKADWLAYYEDQFEAFGDEVEAPRGEVPQAQLQAYIEAKDSYDASVTRGWIIGGVVLAIGLGAFIATLGQLNDLEK